MNVMSKMYKIPKSHWKNGFSYQYGATGKKAYWSYSFKLGRFGIIICRPSRIVPFINIYELI